MVLGLWFLKPANFNRRHREKEKEKAAVVMKNPPRQESPAKRHYQGHFTRLYFEISE